VTNGRRKRRISTSYSGKKPPNPSPSAYTRAHLFSLEKDAPEIDALTGEVAEPEVALQAA
jgi:hypothetical protein